MSRFATRFKHRQRTENITDDDECPIHFFQLSMVCRICGKGVVFYNMAQYGLLYNKSLCD